MTQSQVNQYEALEPEYTPDEIVDRTDTLDQLTSLLVDPGTHLHLYGPRGSGKTLTTKHTLEEASPDTDYYLLDCTRHDTQYKILIKLAEILNGAELASGYHTAQLQDLVADSAMDRRLVLVLDDVDFLLQHDASDLLYYLTRLNHNGLNIITISTNQPDLSKVIDERTYSTLNPRILRIEPYTITQSYKIIEQRARTALGRDRPLPKDALSTIAMSTANIQLALHWLHEAVDATDDMITEKLVNELRSEAVQRYRNHLLGDFSSHHRLLCETIEDLTEDAEVVHTGAIYDHYNQLCRTQGIDPLTTRRLSDYLKDLELLGIIKADYHYGGTEGKTRKIQLQQIE